MSRASIYKYVHIRFRPDENLILPLFLFLQFVLQYYNLTGISTPAASNESRMFCAWAGACDPHPITCRFRVCANQRRVKAAGMARLLTTLSVHNRRYLHSQYTCRRC